MEKREIVGSEFYWNGLIVVPVVCSKTKSALGEPGPPPTAREHQLYYNEDDNRMYIKRSDGLFAVFSADKLFDPETNSYSPVLQDRW